MKEYNMNEEVTEKIEVLCVAHEDKYRPITRPTRRRHT